MPAGPHHSGAAIVLPNTVGEAAGQEQRPYPAAIVDSCYGLESKTMTIYRRDLTPTEATPSSVSDHRLARARTGITSYCGRRPRHVGRHPLGVRSGVERDSFGGTGSYARRCGAPFYHWCRGLARGYLRGARCVFVPEDARGTNTYFIRWFTITGYACLLTS